MQVKACVLTAMERDHMDALGGSIESIALAKAGIFKPGGLAVLARQPFPEAQAVALEHAARIGCSVHTCDSMVQSQGPMALDGALNSQCDLPSPLPCAALVV